MANILAIVIYYCYREFNKPLANIVHCICIILQPFLIVKTLFISIGESSMPHALQWAVRNSLSTSNSSSSTSAAHISGSSLVLFDTAQLRRAVASASSDGSLSNSMYCTPSALARTFFMLTREVCPHKLLVCF